MYKGIPFSPQVALAGGIGAGDTTVPVTDISAFPDAPNLATIGTDEDGETILYTAKTTDSLSGCTRGVEGTAKAWPSGTTIARNDDPQKRPAATDACMIRTMQELAEYHFGNSGESSKEDGNMNGLYEFHHGKI